MSRVWQLLWAEGWVVVRGRSGVRMPGCVRDGDRRGSLRTTRAFPSSSRTAPLTCWRARRPAPASAVQGWGSRGVGGGGEDADSVGDALSGRHRRKPTRKSVRVSPASRASCNCARAGKRPGPRSRAQAQNKGWPDSIASGTVLSGGEKWLFLPMQCWQGRPKGRHFIPV